MRTGSEEKLGGKYDIRHDIGVLREGEGILVDVLLKIKESD